MLIQDWLQQIAVSFWEGIHGQSMFDHMRFERFLTDWMGLLMHTTLSQACSSGFLLYCLSLFKIPVRPAGRLVKLMSDSLLDGE